MDFTGKLKKSGISVARLHSDYRGIDISSQNEELRERSVLKVLETAKLKENLAAKILVLHCRWSQ